jgi:hypothetical protein
VAFIISVEFTHDFCYITCVVTTGDNMDYPRTRKEALITGTAYYFTGQPCKHGHVALRKTKGACVECLKIEWVNTAQKRQNYFVAYNKSERGKESKRRYYEANRETVIARAQARPAEEKRRYSQEWKKNNPVWIRADTKARRRKHRLATPPWITKAQKAEMRELYRIAITMTRTTGEKYVVDHIVPLRGEGVCGLHVPWNLRVITQEENLKKSNRMVLDTTET